MAIYGSKLTFKQPTKAQVALTDELVSVIHEHHSKSREHLFHLCMIAYGLRVHNLMKPKTGAGGNAQGRVYKPAFNDWYQANNLKDVYGIDTNFTHYAMSGRLLEYVRWQVGEKYIARLPGSMTALYSISQILWTQGAPATPESRKLFEMALIKPNKDGSKHNTVIHSSVTRAEINKWRMKQKGQEDVNLKLEPLGKNDPRTVDIGTVKVHKDLFKFDRETGKKRVGPRLKDVQNLTKQLNKLIAEFDAGKSRFALDSRLDEVSRAYSEAENPDFAKKILGARATAKRKIAKKSAGKRA